MSTPRTAETVLPRQTHADLSPRQVARLIGVSPQTVLNRLNACELDGRRRVTQGPWMGCWKRGTHWRIPRAVVERHLGATSDASRAAANEVARLRAKVDELERWRERVTRALLGGNA